MADKRVTPSHAILSMHSDLVATFKTGRTKPIEWRKAQLDAMRRMVIERKDDMVVALTADCGRPMMEAAVAELAVLVSGINHMLNCLAFWMQPESVQSSVAQFPARAEVVREPKGVVLIIAPWNYPFGVALACLATAISAGNCCLLKPSEVSSHSEKLVAELVPKYMDSVAVKVFCGGAAEANRLLSIRWDHIMFTGNEEIGKVVAKAAAEHLTPCTLELGGKSPAVVLPGVGFVDFAVAARRILNGKLINAGQTCIAPDYVLVHKDAEADLVGEMRKVIKSWYGDDARCSSDYGRIIDERHFARLQALLETSQCEVIVQAGEPDQSSKFMPPTVVKAPALDSPLMKEEIFGPILPLLVVDSIQEVVDYINAGEKPLALYIFGPYADASEIIGRTSSGSVCVNDTLMQFSTPGLPFGGVGKSGMGRYHGRWGFDELSNIRAVLYRWYFLDLPQRYPPYSNTSAMIFEKVLMGSLFPESIKRALTIMGGLGAAAAATLVFRARL